MKFLTKGMSLFLALLSPLGLAETITFDFLPTCEIHPANDWLAFQVHLRKKQPAGRKYDSIYALDCRIRSRECLYHKLDLPQDSPFAPLMAKMKADAIEIGAATQTATITVDNVSYHIDLLKNEVTYNARFSRDRGGDETGKGSCK